jgi:N-methylhydantoinase A
VYERSELPLGLKLDGPLIVQEPGSSTVVWPGDRLRIDADSNLRLHVGTK